MSFKKYATLADRVRKETIKFWIYNAWQYVHVITPRIVMFLIENNCIIFKEFVALIISIKYVL